MKKLKPITLPALVREVGGAALASMVGCDPSLPCKWAKGQRPSWKNADALVAVAARKGYALTIQAGGAK